MANKAIALCVGKTLHSHTCCGNVAFGRAKSRTFLKSGSHAWPLVRNPNYGNEAWCNPSFTFRKEARALFNMKGTGPPRLLSTFRLDMPFLWQSHPPARMSGTSALSSSFACARSQPSDGWRLSKAFARVNLPEAGPSSMASSTSLCTARRKSMWPSMTMESGNIGSPQQLLSSFLTSIKAWTLRTLPSSPTPFLQERAGHQWEPEGFPGRCGPAGPYFRQGVSQ